ncbi:MAG: signal recognition particle-docking protein FtsY [Candidatus Altiarchaeales archaeon]|nr:signal recognition particle-docking protein FtsY [Candidatus Altiarchaeales archaeon]MBD3416289.1 signal recognition particle-docking protein FtsY [Candidatus Altiarchaeales archaeon]
MFDSLKQKLNFFMGDVKEKAEPKITASTKVKAAVTGKARLGEADVEDTLWQLQMDLMQSDVAVETAEHIVESLKEKLVGLEVSGRGISDDIRSCIRDVLEESLTPEREVTFLDSVRDGPRPYKVLFLGVNGTGKTTTMAKMAKLLLDNGFSVVFAAGDTFRAGAIEQLQQHAQNIGVNVISHQRGADSAAVIYDAVEHARARNIDVVLADTAGRMQSKTNLMDELKKIIRVNQPDMKLFIGDALAGNDAVEQAKTFNDEVGFEAAVLSKMDADVKGGGALSIVHSTHKPLIYVGVGQKYEDLREFDRSWFIDNILG